MVFVKDGGYNLYLRACFSTIFNYFLKKYFSILQNKKQKNMIFFIFKNKKNSFLIFYFFIVKYSPSFVLEKVKVYFFFYIKTASKQALDLLGSTSVRAPVCSKSQSYSLPPVVW